MAKSDPIKFLRWLRDSGMWTRTWPRLALAAGNLVFAGLCLWAAYAIYHGQLL